MLACRLCGLTIEAIPDDAVLIGKLQRFSNGEFHLLRKEMEPRTGPRPRKNKPREVEVAPPPTIPREVSPPAPKEEPKMEPKKEPNEPKIVKEPEVVPNETSMERAFRLAAL
jgi:hypothetical protein